MRLSFGVCPVLSRSVLFSVASLLIVIAHAGYASAATLTVCASGCAYLDFQSALNAAQPGDTVLLRAGETFVGNFVLPAKGPTDGPSILIRSDAPDTALPGAATRLVPAGRAGGNTALAALARLRGVGGQWKTTPVLQSAPGAHHYRLQFLDIDGVAQEGWGDLLEFGNNSAAQASLAAVPYAIVLDRVFVHGHPTKAQKRCIALNGRGLEVLNSYVAGCASFENDAQAIAAFNGPGPFRIINNYLEASGENVMFGGADPMIPGLVASDIEITRNYFSKPLAWRDPVMARPSAPAVTTMASGGALGVGTHYFTVVAVLDAAGGTALSAPSQEAAVPVRSSGSAVTLTWAPVEGADRYRVYSGLSSGAQNRYVETAGAATSLVALGSGEIAGLPPASGTLWSVKNLLELKNAQRVVIDGNTFEHSWLASQKGYAILLSPRNQDGGASWVAVRDVTLTNNIIRHAGGAINILGDDYDHPSQRTSRITIRNNLVYDISSTWGGDTFLLMTRSPLDVKVDHNTIFHGGMLVLVDDGACSGFELTNNVARHNEYGIFGSGAGVGNSALTAYFPGAIVRRNALGGGPASLYPADNLFPDSATFNSQFVSIAADDFRLVPGSVFRNAGTDGRDVGVDFGALDSAMRGEPAPGASVSVPFGGTPVSGPGTIQAENFDDGGSGLAYQDNTAGNSGGQYRATDVDIEAASDAGGGHNLAWAFAGEWLNYTVNIGAPGSYDLDVRVASGGVGGTFHLEVNGVDVTGRLSVPNTGGWQTWTTIRKNGVSLSAGQQVWRLVMDTNGPSTAVGNFNYIRVAAASAGLGGSPYGGTAVSLPGFIQAENFDEGVAGAAYGDTSAGNAGGQYRATSVDIESSSDAGGGYNVAWAFAGEWLNYTVTVVTAGTYDIDVRVASSGAGGAFHIEIEGVDKTGRMTVPDTGGWQTWTTVRRTGVALSAGPQVWRLVMDANGTTTAVGNFNYVRMTAQAVSTPYGGTPVALPGIIQAENFDDGGAGWGYVDTTSGNSGAQYRTTDVDIERTSDGGSGYSLGWVFAGEWLTYAVNVGMAGTYDFDVRVASAGAGGTFHIEVNGVDKTGPFAVPNTGSWQSWTTLRKTGVVLTAGPQVWRLVMDSNGATTAVGNFNFIRVSGPS